VYKIIIDRLAENPNYAEERTRWLNSQAQQPYGITGYNPEPLRMVPVRALEMDLTEGEFNAVRQAVLQFMDTERLDGGI